MFAVSTLQCGKSTAWCIMTIASAEVLISTRVLTPVPAAAEAPMAPCTPAADAVAPLLVVDLDDFTDDEDDGDSPPPYAPSIDHPPNHSHSEVDMQATPLPAPFVFSQLAIKHHKKPEYIKALLTNTTQFMHTCKESLHNALIHDLSLKAKAAAGETCKLAELQICDLLRDGTIHWTTLSAEEAKALTVDVEAIHTAVGGQLKRRAYRGGVKEINSLQHRSDVGGKYALQRDTDSDEDSDDEGASSNEHPEDDEEEEGTGPAPLPVHLLLIPPTPPWAPPIPPLIRKRKAADQGTGASMKKSRKELSSHGSVDVATTPSAVKKACKVSKDKGVPQGPKAGGSMEGNSCHAPPGSVAHHRFVRNVSTMQGALVRMAAERNGSVFATFAAPLPSSSLCHCVNPPAPASIICDSFPLPSLAPAPIINVHHTQRDIYALFTLTMASAVSAVGRPTLSTSSPDAAGFDPVMDGAEDAAGDGPREGHEHAKWISCSWVWGKSLWLANPGAARRRNGGGGAGEEKRSERVERLLRETGWGAKGAEPTLPPGANAHPQLAKCCRRLREIAPEGQVALDRVRGFPQPQAILGDYVRPEVVVDDLLPGAGFAWFGFGLGGRWWSGGNGGGWSCGRSAPRRWWTSGGRRLNPVKKRGGWGGGTAGEGGEVEGATEESAGETEGVRGGRSSGCRPGLYLNLEED
ncbi:hypothetical protein B0H10DRAFT_1944315 [Mycena sp. CBHHK59/15]|nr:hypothetical protein B0H10DRAFT_1944315 [Mycena sp. CBHHK59/15]